MGDALTLGTGLHLHVTTPVESRIVLIKDGQKVEEVVATKHEWLLRVAGVYRVECYLPQLPTPLNQQPWIISNPVYAHSVIAEGLQRDGR